jgi:hypothetical protein
VYIKSLDHFSHNPFPSQTLSTKRTTRRRCIRAARTAPLTARLALGINRTLSLLRLLELQGVRLAVNGTAGRATRLLIILPPEVPLSVRGALNPRRQNPARQLVSPGVFEVLVGGLDAAAGSLLDDPDGGVDEDVRDDARDEAVGDAVRERHHGDGQERRDGVAHVVPVDFGGGLDHHGADDDERAAGGPGRDGSKDGREEDGDEEAEAGGDGCEACGAAFGDARAGFDESCYRRAEPSKSWVSSSMAPAKRAMEYMVPVQSRMST